MKLLVVDLLNFYNSILQSGSLTELNSLTTLSTFDKMSYRLHSQNFWAAADIKVTYKNKKKVSFKLLDGHHSRRQIRLSFKNFISLGPVWYLDMDRGAFQQNFELISPRFSNLEKVPRPETTTSRHKHPFLSNSLPLNFLSLSQSPTGSFLSPPYHSLVHPRFSLSLSLTLRLSLTLSCFGETQWDSGQTQRGKDNSILASSPPLLLARTRTHTLSRHVVGDRFEGGGKWWGRKGVVTMKGWKNSSFHWQPPPLILTALSFRIWFRHKHGGMEVSGSHK